MFDSSPSSADVLNFVCTHRLAGVAFPVFQCFNHTILKKKTKHTENYLHDIFGHVD